MSIINPLSRDSKRQMATVFAVKLCVDTRGSAGLVAAIVAVAIIIINIFLLDGLLTAVAFDRRARGNLLLDCSNK